MLSPVMKDGFAYSSLPLASGDATVTVEVEDTPAQSPPDAPPPGLADTGLSLLVLLVVAAALTAAGSLLKRFADRLEQGDTP